MVLSDKDLKKALLQKRIVIAPAPDLKVALGSCSIDLRLGNTFRVFKENQEPIDPLSRENIEVTKEIKIKDNEKFIINPGDFVLAVTKEKITISPSLLGRLEGRSSLGRLGIVVHSTASIFDPGWDGQAVLELGNLGKIGVVLYPGMRICSMSFEELSSPAEVPYHKKENAKYLNQDGPDESRIHEE
ncbi:MAG: dCTP deaminase [bacterium]|nr:dCTP deaminase [bacterium]